MYTNACFCYPRAQFVHPGCLTHHNQTRKYYTQEFTFDRLASTITRHPPRPQPHCHPISLQRGRYPPYPVWQHLYAIRSLIFGPLSTIIIHHTTTAHRITDQRRTVPPSVAAFMEMHQHQQETITTHQDRTHRGACWAHHS